MRLDTRGIVNTLIAALLAAYIIGSFVFYRDVTAHMAKVDATMSAIGDNLKLLNETLKRGN